MDDGRSTRSVRTACRRRSRKGPSRSGKTIRIGGGRLDPSLAVEVDVVNTSSERLDGPARHRVRRHAARAAGTIRQPSTRSTGGGSPTTSGSRSATSTAWLRQRPARRHARDRRRRTRERLDRPDRERLELRGRLRARLPGQRHPARPARSPSRPGERTSLRVDQRVTVIARRRAGRRGRGPSVTRGRLAVHAPLLPALPHRSVDRPRAGGAIGGAVPRLERAGRRRVLPAERRARQPRADLVGPRADARGPGSRDRGPGHADEHSLPRRPAATRWPRRSTTRSCRSPPPRIGGPRSAGACASSRSGSAAGRRDSGCPRRRSICRRSGSPRRRGSRYTILAPWQAAEPGIDTRRPYRVELGAGRSSGRGLLRRRPVGVGLVRAGGDL